VSRNTLREAIAALQIIGILEARHSQGNFIISLSETEDLHARLEAIFANSDDPFAAIDARIAFEPGAAFLVPFPGGADLDTGEGGSKKLLNVGLSDPDLLDLADKVTVREDPELQSSFPRLRAGIIRLHMRDGREMIRRIDSPRGMPDNSVSFREIVDKFISEASERLGDQRTSLILEGVKGLDKLQSIADWTGHLSG